MKKIMSLFVLALIACCAMAQEEKPEKYAEIEFEHKLHNFGVVAQDTCVVSCTFTFTNTGNMPLIIHQAISSCGCTVPEYTQEPLQPGQKGTMKVTYNGKTKRPGVFKKSVTIHSNAAVNNPIRIYIEGEMTPSENVVEELLESTITETQQQPEEPTVIEVTPADKGKAAKKANRTPRAKKAKKQKAE